MAQDEAAMPVAAADSNEAQPAKISTWVAGQTMDFRIINADTKEPISDVTLELQTSGPGINFGDVKIRKNGTDGWSRIPLPDLPPTAVRVYPVKEGFVPLRVILGDRTTSYDAEVDHDSDGARENFRRDCPERGG